MPNNRDPKMDVCVDYFMLTESNDRRACDVYII